MRWTRGPGRSRHQRSEESTQVEVQWRRGRPVRVRLGGRRVEVLDLVEVWVIQGRWWAVEEHRLYLRVRTRAGTLDLYRRKGDPKDLWTMERVLD